VTTLYLFTFYLLPQNGYVLSLFLCLFKQGTPNDEANVENICQFDRFLMRYGLIEQKKY